MHWAKSERHKDGFHNAASGALGTPWWKDKIYSYNALLTVMGDSQNNSYLSLGRKTRYEWIVHSLKELGEYEHFRLIYGILHGFQGTSHIEARDTRYKPLLDSAPEEGPYHFREWVTTWNSNGYFVYHNPNDDWTSVDRLREADNRFGSTVGNFNGLDYMLLHNLYWLAYKQPGDNFHGFAHYSFPIPEVDGDDPLCSSDTYSLDNLPSGANVTWSASPSNKARLTPSGNSVIFSKLSDGKITLMAKVEMADYSYNRRKVIWLGKPTVPTISPSGSLTMALGNYYQITAHEPLEAHIQSYSWGTGLGGPNNPIVPYGATNYNRCTFYGQNLGTGIFVVRASNNCGLGAPHCNIALRSSMFN